jgi:hypothetical protein
MSADRGGHHGAADMCETALAHMATLPAWRGVNIEHDASAKRTSLSLDLTGPVDDGRLDR